MILRSVAEMQAASRGWQRAGQVVGVVPTMGALHEGHLSLVRAAQAECDRVVVTIFVNPRQFNNPADLVKYPRTEEADAALLAPLGVDAIFAPTPDQVYPEGFATNVSVSGVAGPLEGANRPGHFDGVATVVTKLFGMTLAQRGYFGEKDWQQLAVVRRLVADLNLAVEIVGCPTLRDTDGLAMSSRNARLSAAARTRAPALHRAMQDCVATIAKGAPQEAALAACRATILAAGFEKIDYVERVDAASLGPARAGAPTRLLAAAWLDGVRLIDNIAG